MENPRYFVSGLELKSSLARSRAVAAFVSLEDTKMLRFY